MHVCEYSLDGEPKDPGPPQGGTTEKEYEGGDEESGGNEPITTSEETEEDGHRAGHDPGNWDNMIRAVRDIWM